MTKNKRSYTQPLYFPASHHYSACEKLSAIAGYNIELFATGKTKFNLTGHNDF